MPGAREAYAGRARTHAAAADRARGVSIALSRWRLATSLPAFALLIWGSTHGGVPPFAVAAILLIVFTILVVRHARVEERVRWLDALRIVNEWSVARLDRDWDGLPRGDAPGDLSLETHPYALDLDVFGRASLFQWLGPAATPHGGSTLVNWLLAPAQPSVAGERHRALDDLADRAGWREHLAAYGATVRDEPSASIDAFLNWVERDAPPIRHLALLRTAVYVVLGSLWLLIAVHAAGITPALWPIPLVAGIVISFVTAVPVQRVFDAAGSGERALRRYAPLFTHLLSPSFRAPLLNTLQGRLRSDTEPASAAMTRLNRILGCASLRQGAAILHFLIQAFTLWDFHVLFALLRWRRTVSRHVRDWLEAAGEIDALACLSAVRHDYPEWCFPRPASGKILKAASLGHPLLRDDRRVINDVDVGPPGTVLLITGSNMSGKSTLLRAIGSNAVLAQAGAPVCAADLEMPAADLFTSIHVHDSLERGISYFMAGLARLKAVVDAAERESSERVFLYLLDEILQGTNSAERAVAVQAVAQHLLDAGAIGAMTTHDLRLAEEEPLRSSAVLVHFTERVDESGGMTFDYKLRPGIATSTNALRLMRLIGIR